MHVQKIRQKDATTKHKERETDKAQDTIIHQTKQHFPPNIHTQSQGRLIFFVANYVRVPLENPTPTKSPPSLSKP